VRCSVRLQAEDVFQPSGPNRGETLYEPSDGSAGPEVAALYVLLGAEFLAVIQILVYAGGIVVLYLFVVMLVNLKRPPEAYQDPRRQTKLGFGLAAAILLELAVIASYSYARPVPVPAAALPVTGNTEQVGWMLYTSYLIPFEIASMLLLVAMIGAIILAKRDL